MDFDFGDGALDDAGDAPETGDAGDAEEEEPPPPPGYTVLEKCKMCKMPRKVKVTGAARGQMTAGHTRSSCSFALHAIGNPAKKQKLN